jgi:hypothetical protein
MSIIIINTICYTITIITNNISDIMAFIIFITAALSVSMKTLFLYFNHHHQHNFSHLHVYIYTAITTSIIHTITDIINYSSAAVVISIIITNALFCRHHNRHRIVTIAPELSLQPSPSSSSSFLPSQMWPSRSNFDTATRSL